MKLEIVEVKKPEGTNVILGQSHFIKTVEDIHEALVNSVPNIKFGLAFCESSGDRLVRTSGTDEELEKVAAENVLNIGAGHCFMIVLRDCYPINVLNAVKHVPEVCRIFCATANPLQVVVVETSQGRAILGVIDGEKPKGIEDEEKVKERKEFLRKIGYKLG